MVKDRAGVGSAAVTCRVMLGGGVRVVVVPSLKKAEGKWFLAEMWD